ncbi:phage tail tape measure protein [Clostridium botulinum]|uniref:phage tail tape measure protein n=1 Tax=Clostridium botulinum TaxID=1491 RepID=UPI001AD90A5A|nr:phage tail tape measure protein [Clostridium botulinum]
MSGTLRTIESNVAGFDRNLNNLGKSAGKIGRNLGSVGSSISKLGDKMKIAAIPIAAAGIASAKMAMDFGENIANINTLLDDPSHLETYKRQVLDVSKQTGMSLDIVAKGMYTAVSSIGDGKETQAIFKTMANAAKAGGAEVNDSVALISAAMKGYGSINDTTAKKISDLAFQTAKLGVTTFPEMAKSMQPLFPLAKNLNFSYEELFGTMATLTGVTGNTSEVSTQLKAVFSNMMKPTKEMSALMQKYGFSNAQAMVKSKGLAGTIDILKKETGGQADKMSKLFSSTEAVTAIMALTGANYSDLINKTKEMGIATGSTDKALEKISSTTKDKFNKSINNLKVTMVEFGEILLPIVTKITDGINMVITKLNSLTPAQKKTVIEIGLFIIKATAFIVILGKVTSKVGSTLKSFNKFTRSVKDAGGILKWITSPAHLVVLAITAILVVLALLIIHWKDVCEFTKKAKEKLIELKEQALDKLKNILDTVKEKWKKLNEKINDFREKLKKAEPQIKSVAKVLGTIFGPALVKTGVKAGIAGGKIAGQFVASVVKTGTQAVINGAKLTGSFIASITKTGAQAVIAGAKLTGSFVISIIKTGVQAGKTAAIITGKLIIAIINYALQGWKAVASITAQTIAWIVQKAIVVAHTIGLIALKVAQIGLTGATTVLTGAVNLLNLAFVATPIGWIVLGIAGIITAVVLLYKAWKENWGGIQEKTKAVIDKIKEWWNNLKEFFKHPIKGTIELAKKGAAWVQEKVSGSHATGLQRVPYNGYMAELHEDERILTKQQARELERGKGSNGININIDKMEVRNDSDIERVAEALARKLNIYQANLA